MKYLFFFALLPLFFSEIIKISPEEFPLFTYQYPNSLVLFYLPNCKLSDRFLIEYQKTATFIENAGYNLVFSQMDMTLPGEKPFNDIKIYPNLRIFLEGRPSIEYLGVYSEKDLIVFIENLLYKPPIIEIDDGNSIKFDGILKKNEVVIAFFGVRNGKDAEIFNSIALNSKEHTYLFVISEDIKGKYIKEKNDVVIFRQCGSSKSIEKIYYNSSFNPETLKVFIEENSLNCNNLFTEKIAQMIFGKESDPFIILFIDPKAQKEIFEVYADFAQKMNRKILLTYSEITYGLGFRMARLIGVSQKDLPKAFIIVPNGDELIKYVFTKGFTQENLMEFYENWHNKRMIGYLRSGNDTGETDEIVKKINAKDFQKKVIDEEKNVVVIFEKPMCSVCKTVKNILERFIEKNPENLIGYRMNYLNDEVEEIKVGSFPGVYLFAGKDRMNPKYFIDEKNEKKLWDFFGGGKEKGKLYYQEEL